MIYRELLKLRTDKRYRPQTRLRMDYDKLMQLSQHNAIKPLVKAYRVDAILSKFIKVPAQEWEITLGLNTARMQNMSNAQAWKENLKKAKNG